MNARLKHATWESKQHGIRQNIAKTSNSTRYSIKLSIKQTAISGVEEGELNNDSHCTEHLCLASE